MEMSIRPAGPADAESWLCMRQELWPATPEAVHRREIANTLNSPELLIVVAETDTGALAGFLEASIRAFADGCETDHVGYIEGWYVDAPLRNQGVGARLVAAAEAWARGQGCIEMGSDCLLDNTVSLAAHRALGYQDVERLIHFVKRL